MRRLFLFIISLFLLFPSTVFATTYPDYTGYVNDFAHVLSPQFSTQLNAKLHAFDTKTTNQIAVVTVQSTQPDVIEDYSIHLADKWKVGHKGKDNGIIMLFAMQDHRMRIEVGRGLEGDLTDIQSKHILTDIITPEFRQGKYEEGISQGIDAIITEISHGKISPKSLTSDMSPPPQTTDMQTLINFLPFIIILLFGIISIAFSPKTKLGGRGVWGFTTLWGDIEGGSDNSGDSGGGFGVGGFSGGGSSGSW